MDDFKKIQMGSPSRDAFKQRHKQLRGDLYGCDIDFVLVEKTPVPDIIAALDYKVEGDDVSFAEVIAYNGLIMRGIPVYIVTGDAMTGEFRIDRYTGGNHKPKPPEYHLEFVQNTTSWSDFEKWETLLRHEHCKKFMINGGDVVW